MQTHIVHVHHDRELGSRGSSRQVHGAAAPEEYFTIDPNIDVKDAKVGICTLEGSSM